MTAGQVAPVVALFVTAAAVQLVPGRSRRAERITNIIICLGALAILGAFALELYGG